MKNEKINVTFKFTRPRNKSISRDKGED